MERLACANVNKRERKDRGAERFEVFRAINLDINKVVLRINDTIVQT